MIRFLKRLEKAKNVGELKVSAEFRGHHESVGQSRGFAGPALKIAIKGKNGVEESRVG